MGCDECMFVTSESWERMECGLGVKLGRNFSNIQLSFRIHNIQKYLCKFSKISTIRNFHL